MSLTQKIYEACLTAFKDEVLCNPDADFTQPIQELTAKLRAWEKNVIDDLFLTLYDQDAHALKEDLCTLRASEPAKQAAPSEQQHTSLITYLYLDEAFSSYIKKNRFSIIEVCKRGVAAKPKPYGTTLSDFKDEVRRDPDADFTPHIQKLAAEFEERRIECEKNIYNELFLYLYAQDTALLERDLAKLLMMEPKIIAKAPKRTELLPHLCAALSSHIKGDFSDIIAMCEGLDKQR